MNIGNIIRKYKTCLFLSAILLLALFIRLYRLNSIPANFHEDEVLAGYVGRFILQNGRDLYGNHWPLLYFNKFGDFYIIWPIYLSGIATYFFGINEFATRFPAAFFGALAVIPVFFLTLWIFRNRTVALLAAFFMAISPWNIVLSRSTTEGIIGSTILLSGILLTIQGIRKQKITYVLTGSALCLITYFIYHPFRLYIPLVFLINFILFYKVKVQKKFALAYLSFFLFFIVATLYISTTSWGKGRFIQTSIFSPLSGVSRIQHDLIADEKNGHILVSRIFHNKAVVYGREFLRQFFSYFSPNYLFIDGWQKTRYVVPDMGLFYLTWFFFLAVALIPRKNDQQISVDKTLLAYTILLVAVAIIPAALTVVESPNLNRTSFMGYILVTFFAYGLYKSRQFTYKKLPLLTIGLCVTMGIEMIYFWHQYSKHFDFFSSMVRNDGQKQLALYARSKEKNYEEIQLPAEGAMSWYYLFYSQDFNPNYAGKFKLDARITRTNKVHYIESSCPATELTTDELKKNRNLLVVNRYWCIEDDRFIQIGDIRGANPLLGYKLLVPIPIK
ncbi:glycosyltransferase family 39 protein [Candidatus Roizmanbacteria bacterium]|nr:glycosyltransferase family 39 protein [Candidatus Roizmanbacteria bacterium]